MTAASPAVALGPAQRGVQRRRAQVALARHPGGQLDHPGPEQFAVDLETSAARRSSRRSRPSNRCSVPM